MPCRAPGAGGKRAGQRPQEEHVRPGRPEKEGNVGAERGSAGAGPQKSAEGPKAS